MELKRLTERIWYYPFEESRDRPNLGYVRGDRWSLAIDAGHSAQHVEEFYRALTEAGLPFPALTVLTHWHWDHSFGLHAIRGLSLANRQTDGHLRDFRSRLDREGPGFFYAIHDSIRLEYADKRPVTVIPADLTFTGEMTVDAGGCPIRIFQSKSPHTDDATLICVPDEHVLFLGDALYDTFETGEKDPALCRSLADAIRASGAEICLEGHWQPTSPGESLAELESGI